LNIIIRGRGRWYGHSHRRRSSLRVLSLRNQRLISNRFICGVIVHLELVAGGEDLTVTVAISIGFKEVYDIAQAKEYVLQIVRVRRTGARRGGAAGGEVSRRYTLTIAGYHILPPQRLLAISRRRTNEVQAQPRVDCGRRGLRPCPCHGAAHR